MDENNTEVVEEVTESPTTITLPDPEPAEDTEASPANDNADGTQRQTRKERRSDRYREAHDRANEAERRFQTAETERQRLSEQIAELRGRTDAIQRQQQQARPDPYEAQLTDLDKKAQRHLAAAANAKDAATAQSEMDEYHRSTRAAAALEARKGFQEDLRQFSANMPDPAQAGMKVALVSEYPWLETNVQARNAADAYIALLMSRDKRPSGLATFREACALAARDFGIGGTADRPSDARRAAYAGVSARTGAGGDDGKTQVQMSANDGRSLKIMASHLYPSLDAEDAWKKYQREVMPGLAKK